MDRRPNDDKGLINSMPFHLISNRMGDLINIMSLSAGTPNSLISAPGTKTLCTARKKSDRIRIRRGGERGKEDEKKSV